MPKAAEETQEAVGRTIEEALPQMLDGVLARFQEVGVQRILELADQMVRARLAMPEAAHLTPGPGQSN
jgi:hypothetical protein